MAKGVEASVWGRGGMSKVTKPVAVQSPGAVKPSPRVPAEARWSETSVYERSVALVFRCVSLRAACLAPTSIPLCGNPGGWRDSEVWLASWVFEWPSPIRRSMCE